MYSYCVRFIITLLRDNLSSFSHLFGIRVRAETGMEDPRSRVSGTSLSFEEALGLGKYQDTTPVQIRLQPSGARNRTYLKKKNDDIRQ